MDNFKFRRIVAKYASDMYVKLFSCWNQLLVMMFGQLSNRESLRDLIVAMEAHNRKLYHLGMGRSFTRSNLAKANESRDYRIFEEFANHMIDQARRHESPTFSVSAALFTPSTPHTSSASFRREVRICGLEGRVDIEPASVHWVVVPCVEVVEA